MTYEHAFRVAQLKDNHVPTVTSDHYIPVTIQWAAPDFRSPVPLVVYVRVSGLADGELEFTLDRSSGELRRLIILDLGPIAIESTPQYPDVPVDEGCGLVIDASLWRDSTRNVISLEWLLRFYRLPTGVRIDFAGVEPTQLVVCGPLLTLGLSTDGVLASIAVRTDIDEHHFQT